eukprot:TRINITY_DN5122_c0_g1_i1.p1 TRINITY_DN5122_c0_g1~~TRINITY_DN5122_c0_g1_i1.p1  ORF type:complete len:373 (+),score=42.28 TRINITY_DN5122_c0_g1_i1:92-1210(+)
MMSPSLHSPGPSRALSPPVPSGGSVPVAQLRLAAELARLPRPATPGVAEAREERALHVQTLLDRAAGRLAAAGLSPGAVVEVDAGSSVQVFVGEAWRDGVVTSIAPGGEALGVELLYPLPHGPTFVQNIPIADVRVALHGATPGPLSPPLSPGGGHAASPPPHCAVEDGSITAEADRIREEAFLARLAALETGPGRSGTPVGVAAWAPASAEPEPAPLPKPLANAAAVVAARRGGKGRYSYKDRLEDQNSFVATAAQWSISMRTPSQPRRPAKRTVSESIPASLTRPAASRPTRGAAMSTVGKDMSRVVRADEYKALFGPLAKGQFGTSSSQAPRIGTERRFKVPQGWPDTYHLAAKPTPRARSVGASRRAA